MNSKRKMYFKRLELKICQINEIETYENNPYCIFLEELKCVLFLKLLKHHMIKKFPLRNCLMKSLQVIADTAQKSEWY